MKWEYSFYLSGGVYARTIAADMNEAVANIAREYPYRHILVTLAIFPAPTEAQAGGTSE